MKRYRRLRRLEPDEQLVRRRAGGEPLRPLASDYDVSHTTLSRYFARPAVANEIKQTQRLLRAEAKAAWARQRDELQSRQQAEGDARHADAGADASDRLEDQRSTAPVPPMTLQEQWAWHDARRLSGERGPNGEPPIEWLNARDADQALRHDRPDLMPACQRQPPKRRR